MRTSTERFSDRVDDYIRHRPSYPADVIKTLQSKTGLSATATVADVGSGTGIFTKLLLPHCARVFAIEPNASMRAAAERELAGNNHFTSIAATAEATTLPDASVDLVTAAQAFHWFESAKCRREFARILRPGGMIALVWNLRLTDATPFLRDYEALLRRHAPEYTKVSQLTAPKEQLAEFFGPQGYQTVTFDYEQIFDYAGLSGRLLSSSYAPNIGQPGHHEMMTELKEIYTRNQQQDSVAFLYHTKLYYGRLS